jgi:transcriptional regulator with XRE-family HTH domain
MDLPDRKDEPVGGRLRLLRLLRGESQMHLAETLGLTIPQMNDFEKGTSEFSEGQLQKLSIALNIPLSFFNPS